MTKAQPKWQWRPSILEMTVKDSVMGGVELARTCETGCVCVLVAQIQEVELSMAFGSRRSE